MALPRADAKNLTTCGWRRRMTLLGNASEGRSHMNTSETPGGSNASGCACCDGAEAPVSRSSLAGRMARTANPTGWSITLIAEMAVAIALAAALGQLKIVTMPQGGSVSLELLPILVIAIRRGFVPGIAVGFLYGLIQLMLPGAFIFSPLQAALDYPIAFAALGLAGLVEVRDLNTKRAIWRVSAAVALGCAARLIPHFLSGVIFFAEYAPAWEGVWLYALTYNLLFLVPEAIITGFLLWPILKALDAALPRTVPATG